MLHSKFQSSHLLYNLQGGRLVKCSPAKKSILFINRCRIFNCTVNEKILLHAEQMQQKSITVTAVIEVSGRLLFDQNGSYCSAPTTPVQKLSYFMDCHKIYEMKGMIRVE